MKILHVITSANPRVGGPIEGIRQRARVLADMGHHVEVVSADDPNAEFIQEFPLPLHALGPGKSSFGYTPTIVPWLRKNLANYDAVVVNGIWQYPNLALGKVAKELGRPYWVFPHGMLDPWFNRTYPLKKFKKMLYWPWQHAVLRDARAVLFTCEEERILARQSFSPYRVTEIVVSYGTATPTGDAEAQKREFIEAFPALRGRPYLLFLSRVHPKKGCDLLLEAFAQTAALNPELVLVMAGPDRDGYRSQLDPIIEKHHLQDRVVWTGMLQGDVKWGAFHGCEAFILPSHQENFGIAVVEALACAKPVLITRPVNIWREIEADDAGLVEEDTLEGVVNLLKKWHVTSQFKRAEMGQNAKACFEARFTIERSAETLLDAITAKI